MGTASFSRVALHADLILPKRGGEATISSPGDSDARCSQMLVHRSNLIAQYSEDIVEGRMLRYNSLAVDQMLRSQEEMVRNGSSIAFCYPENPYLSKDRTPARWHSSPSSEINANP